MLIRRKAVALTSVLIVLASPLFICLATANFICFLPTITIHSDGTVEPETRFIRQNGNVYTLTADVIREYVIKIQRSNIVFDGAGHTIDGSLPTLGYSNEGFVVQGMTNVTIKNLEVTGFINHNILISSCSEVSVLNVTASNIALHNSDFNTIAESIFGDFAVRLASHNNVITENNISTLIIEYSDDNAITKNNVTELFVFGGASNFFINNFVCEENGLRHVGDKNRWDNGSIGNYWSDYDGTDVNGDGVGDTPYVIDAANQDRYPLMNMWHPTIPFDTVPPRITVVSPGNTVYNESSIQLVFSICEPASSMSFSLDGQENFAIAGNTTLGELPNGSHNLTVYVTDQSGNTGFSETIYFTVDVPEPFPTTLIVASVITVAVYSIGLLVYFKKRQKARAKA